MNEKFKNCSCESSFCFGLAIGAVVAAATAFVIGAVEKKRRRDMEEFALDDDQLCNPCGDCDSGDCSSCPNNLMSSPIGGKPSFGASNIFIKERESEGDARPPHSGLGESFKKFCKDRHCSHTEENAVNDEEIDSFDEEDALS